MKTHMELGADQFIELIFTRDRNEGSRDRNEESVVIKVLIITRRWPPTRCASRPDVKKRKDCFQFLVSSIPKHLPKKTFPVKLETISQAGGHCEVKNFEKSALRSYRSDYLYGGVLFEEPSKLHAESEISWIMTNVFQDRSNLDYVSKTENYSFFGTSQHRCKSVYCNMTQYLARVKRPRSNLKH